MAPNLNEDGIAAVELETEKEGYKAGEEVTPSDEEVGVEEAGDAEKQPKEPKKTKPFIVLVAACAALGEIAVFCLLVRNRADS